MVKIIKAKRERSLMKDGYNVAVVGATGAVGTKLIEMLEQTNYHLKT